MHTDKIFPAPLRSHHWRETRAGDAGAGLVLDFFANEFSLDVDLLCTAEIIQKKAGVQESRTKQAAR
jgi:hypothetical protein